MLWPFLEWGHDILFIYFEGRDDDIFIDCIDQYSTDPLPNNDLKNNFYSSMMKMQSNLLVRFTKAHLIEEA